MIMGTAYDNTTLMYDQVHRRDPESHGSTRYPQHVQQTHKEWTRQISESSEAKVEVVYGAKAIRAIMTDPEVKMTPLPLWGEYSGMILLLIHEENFRNAQDRYKFRKIMVRAYHPQRLFVDPVDGQYVCYQEQAITVAAAMARVHHIPNYYREKLWLLVRPPSVQRHLEAILRRYPSQAQAIEFSKHLYNDILEDSHKEPAMESSTTSWERYFKENPHGNKTLYELLPAAIEAVTQADQDYNNPLEFPPPVLLWWEGQKQILFYDVEVSGPKVILSILNNCQKATPGFKSSDTSSLPNLLKGLMEIQKQRLEQEKGIKNPQHKKSVYVHSRFDGRGVLTKCAKCGKGTGAVSNPTYSANRPNHFVVSNKVKCLGCGKRTKRLPIHGPHTIAGTIYSAAPKIKHGARIESIVQLQQTLTQQQLRPVDSVCLRCGEKTEVMGGGNVYIDLKPRWTLGNRRPLYVERRTKCLSCQKLNRTSDRFIPKDQAVPSIHPQVLADLADRYGRYDSCIIAILLDHWPQSSRTFRNRVQGV